MPNPGRPDRFALSPDGRLLAVNWEVWGGQPVSDTGRSRLDLWDLDTGKVRATWLGAGDRPGPRFSRLAFAAGGRRLVSLDDRGALAVWDVDTGKVLSFQPGWGQGLAVAVSPDGRWLFSAMSFPHAPWVEVQESEVGASPDTGPGTEDSEFRARYHPAAETARGNRRTRQWRVEPREAAVGTLALSPDGTTLALGETGGAVRLWRLPTGEDLVRWDAHAAEITNLTFSPDGTLLASGSLDGTARLWDLRWLRKELAALDLDWPDSPSPNPKE